jgi:transcriptional regulator with XRE-family HTH domain
MNQLFDPAAFGRTLAEELSQRQLSYRQAERLIGTDKATLQRVTKGMTPSVENYLRITQWLSNGSSPGRDEP